MPGDVFDAIRYFGLRGKIHHVHFRNVTGTVPAFAETFIDEGCGHGEGDASLPRCRLRRPHGRGPRPGDGRRPDQWPAKAFAPGYMKAAMQAAHSR